MKQLAPVFAISALIASFALIASPRPSFAEPVPEAQAGYNGMTGLKQLLPEFDFKGGTVAEFVDALREAARPQELNIIVFDPMTGTKIAPVKLKSISVESALRLLSGPLSSKPVDVSWVVPQDYQDNPVVYIKAPNSVASEMAERAVQEERRKTAVLSSQIGPPREGEEGKAREMQLAITLDAVGEALNLNVQPGKPLPNIRFHNPSGLLFVVGQPSEIAIAREVVNQIAQDARDAHSAQAQQVGIAQLQRELDALRARDATAAAEALKPVEVRVSSDGVNLLDLKLAVESAMRLAPNVPGRNLEVSVDSKGLVLKGDRELVRNAENAAIGARTALFLKSRQPSSNGSPVDKK